MRSICWVAVLAAIMIAAPAQAVIISQLEPAPGVAMADANWGPITVVNNHILVPLKIQYYDQSMMEASQIIQFKLEAADAGKDIWLVNYDDSGDPSMCARNLISAWTEYHIRVTNDPTFAPTYANAQFANLDNVTSDAFGDPTSYGNNTAGHYGFIDFTEGLAPYGSTVHFTGIQIQKLDNSNGVFWLKLMPVPEPATLGILGLGALLVARRRKSRA